MELESVVDWISAVFKVQRRSNAQAAGGGCRQKEKSGKSGKLPSYISARELFGDSDDEEDDSPDSEKEEDEFNPEKDFDTFYSDDDDDGEEAGDDEISDDTMGGETIINLNFK